MSEEQNFGGGGILPPSPEEYRQMWEQQSKELKPNEYKRQAEANKQAARRQVFQESVQKAVEVRDPRLTELFHSNINIQDRE